MASSEYNLDTRIRRRHVPLLTQQRRLRHLRSISARNITISNDNTQCVDNEFMIVFTLHKKLDSAAFYTSEESSSLNPSWKDFESSNFPDNVDSASPYVIVRVWGVSETRKLLIEWAVFFTGLVFLGEQIPKEGKNFKPNTIIFGMSEGYYGCNDSYQYVTGLGGEFSARECLDAEVSSLRTSCTLSTLSRIKTVERAIKQTQAAVQRRRDSIGDRLQRSRELQELRAQREMLRIRVSVLAGELQLQEGKLQRLRADRTRKEEELHRKKDEIRLKSEELRRSLEKRLELSKVLNESREALLKTEAQLAFRRKELVTELSSVYPIAEVVDSSGATSFSIHNVHLPNSESFYGHDDTMLSVALGYVCHFVLMVSQFLNVPLRYPINFYGSRSTIVDHISSSLPDKTREFPLHLKKTERRNFEYGVFLLNKNIAQIRMYYKLSTQDLRATLPNLHSLVELRLSVHSDSLPVPRELKAPLQNGLPDFPKVPSSPDVLQGGPLLPPPPLDGLLSKESSALSSSLDRGLDDMRLLEQSMEPLEATKEAIGAVQARLLRQSGPHHASHPNLSSPPGDEAAPAVLNDSVFYVPSSLEQQPAGPADDFSADLSVRTERRARRKSSFQMQKLRSSSAEEDELQPPDA